MNSTIKKSQLEELVTAITKTLLHEIREGKEESWSDMMQRVETDYNRNIKDPAYTNYKRTDPRDSTDQDGNKLAVPVDEESTASAVAPVNGKLPINRRVMENDNLVMRGTFVDRGQVKLEGGIGQQVADKIANYHWDIMQSMGKDDRGIFNYKTRGDRWCCSVGLLKGEPAILSITTTPGRLNLLIGNKEIFGNNTLEEMSDSSGAGSYNIPSAFSRRDGGSSKALAGSEALGYELTPQGHKDFERHPDAMLE